jgi:Zn-dependent peptidase ImmA (M78 family)
MPREFLEADLAKLDLLDDDLLRALAKKYGVSTQALVDRLKDLGYIQE